MKNNTVPVLLSSQSKGPYTVEQACTILSLKPAMVSKLCRKYQIQKIRNKYYIPHEKLSEIIQRKNRCIKGYDL